MDHSSLTILLPQSTLRGNKQWQKTITPEISICNEMQLISSRYFLFLKQLFREKRKQWQSHVLRTLFGASQKRSAQKGQSDWPLFGETFNLNWDSYRKLVGQGQMRNVQTSAFLDFSQNNSPYPMRVKCKTTDGSNPLSHKSVMIPYGAEIFSIQTVHFDYLARRATDEK